MKKAGLVLLIILIVALVAGVILFIRSSSNSPYNAEVIQNNPPSNVGLPAQNEKISLSELSAHNSKGDCWVSYKRQVYDITSWLPIHPGSSAAIEPYCGTAEEFERAFEGQHGTSKVETLKKMGTYKGELE